MTRPLILVTNDDGVLAPGLGALAKAMRPLGDVVVCAPDSERSGSSHSITLHSHLRVNEVKPGWWCTSGTPVDCVYLAALQICQRVPDLVASGVNAGYNLGADVLYSGTVGAAAEGHIRGAAAMAVSVDRTADPRTAIGPARAIARRLLSDRVRRLVNVNVGPGPGDAAPTLEITRLGHRPYQDAVEERRDPMGRSYYFIGGPAAPHQPQPGEDTFAVTRGAVSVTPLELDLTAREPAALKTLLAELSLAEENEDEPTS